LGARGFLLFYRSQSDVLCSPIIHNICVVVIIEIDARPDPDLIMAAIEALGIPAQAGCFKGLIDRILESVIDIRGAVIDAGLSSPSLI
jgi:hypothetical protein